MSRQICDSNSRNKDIWNFKGTIYNEYDINYKLIYWDVEGKVFIGEDNSIKTIYIEGKTEKNEKFYLNGNESKKTEKISYFKIKKKPKENTFDFDDDILMIKINYEYSKITGNLKYRRQELKMDLDLEKEKKDIMVINYRYNMPKFTEPVDIISNSLCGMKNLINTCYINSSFQILIHILELVKIIRKNKDFQENVIGNINTVFNKIIKHHKDSRPVIDPSIFVLNFKREHKEYNNHFQMDSEMFLEELIWNINLELGNLGIKRSIDLLKAKNEKEKLFWNYLIESEEESFYEINDLFYVRFIHENKCLNEDCNYVTYYFDETTGLKLNFTNVTKINDINLTTLIMNNFKKTIQIKSSYVCQKCKKNYYINETTRIAKLPKILILSLQRTNFENTRKIPWVVTYLDKLEIKDLIDPDICNENTEYKLFAINNHLGYSPRSGHYYSMIFLEKSERWFCFNDESVSPIPAPTPSLNNYILIYKQI